MGVAEAAGPLSKQEFDTIYSKVPRLTVEVVMVNEEDETLLSKRAVEPCKDTWHLPGGTVRYGESLLDAVKRIANREIGIDVLEAKFITYIEYLGHFQKGLDHPVGLAFKVTSYKGEIRINEEASEYGWFGRLPENIHPEQDKFLVENNFMLPR